MISLHHITHAVCFVVISFVLKKYVELRSVHSNLRFEHDALKRACLRGGPGGGAETRNGVCFCPCQSSHQYLPSQTDVRTHLEMLSGHSGQQQSAAHGEMFADVLTATGVPVDEFGKSLDHADGNNVGQEFQGTTLAVYSQKSQLSPLHHQLPPMQPSFTSTAGVSMGTRNSEYAAARQRGDGWTGTDQKVSVSFHKTSESLESVQLSPSTSFAHSNEKSSVADRHAHLAEENAAEGNSDFYLGSSSSENGEEEEVNVIVTSADSTLNDAFYPHGAVFSQGDYDDEYEDWEDGEGEITEKEAEPHPAFGNVPLHWLSDAEVDRMSAQGSAVQCTGSTQSDRLCRFRDLCIKPQSREFVFLLSAQSVQDNVPDLGPQEALLELSTVAGHNAQYFSYLTIPSTDVRRFQVASVAGATVLFKRFKPDNIMHVFHDDIIPLFHTLDLLEIKARPAADKERFPVSLFLADQNNEGEFYYLYDAFAAHNTFTLESLIASVAKATASDSLVCFSEAHVGLSKTTTWYQYGFFEPQGPIPNSEARSHHVHGVSSLLLNSLSKDCPFCGDGGHLVLISRKDTRRILNEMDLVLAISKEFKVKVMTVSLETHSLGDIIPIIHSSRGIIGMHGSLLSLAVFLKQGSIMVELFPYAVDPGNYAPYRMLCQIPGMLITYRAWSNEDAESSVAHPDWPADVGGLQHLPLQQQQEISAQTQVPSHLCCEDPSWLYHIFQDTYVNIAQVLVLIASALKEARPLQTDLGSNRTPKTKRPGPVQNLRCTPELSQRHSSLVLQWRIPWNVELLRTNSISYNVILQDVDSGRSVAINAGPVVKVKVTKGVEKGRQYRVWVRCVVDGVHGPFASVELCSTKQG